jgi:iron complex transport system substrate-binding protein
MSRARRAAAPRAAAWAASVRRTLQLALLTLAGALPGLAGPASAQAVLDDAQRMVRLARPAGRIVSLAPGITELLFDMGAGDRVVAVSEFSDTPDAARALPKVARAQAIDLEAIAALRPDLIVVWGSGYPPALLEALRQLSFPVYVYEPRTLESIATSIDRLGTLSASQSAPTIAAAFRARLLALRQRYEQRPPVRVFYQIWSNPIMTLSGRHVASEILRLCGARNVFADVLPLVATVDVESVLAARPQLIVTSEPGGVDRGALELWRAYRQLPAVANDHLVTLDADQMDRQTTRTLDAAQKLCFEVERARH